MRTLRYLIEFIIIHFLFIIFKFIGYEKASNLGYKIGSTFGNYFKSKELINNKRKGETGTFATKAVLLL